MRRLALLTALAMTTALPALAQKSADTLRVAWRDQIADVDPYYNNLRTGLVVAHHAWDTLVYRDPEGFVMKPLLATSWKWLDDTTLEFELRRDATFHNGDKVTAADVVYTVGIITDPKSGISVPSNFVWLAGAEAIDEYHVRLKLKQAFPAALEFVSFVMPIYPKAYREKVGRDDYAKAPVGAGPYRITKVDGVNEIDLERYEGYYAGSSKGRPPIKRVVIKEVTDSSTELAMIMGGQADWIWQFNPDQFDKIGTMPNLTTLRQEAMRVAHWRSMPAGRSGDEEPADRSARAAGDLVRDRPPDLRQTDRAGRLPGARCAPAISPSSAATSRPRCITTTIPAKAKAVAGRGRLSQRLRHRDRLAAVAAMGRGDPELPRRGGHPRQGVAVAGDRRGAARRARRRPDVPEFVGLVFDQ